MKRQIILIILLLTVVVLGAAGQTCKQYVNLLMEDPQSDSLVLAIIANSDQTVSMPCTYKSVDQHGDDVTLSGKIYFPLSGKPKNILLESHYTITGNSECPSECDMPQVLVLRDKGYAVVMPDYLGYGITRGREHPYLHSALTAQNVVDMYFAAKQFLERMEREPENDSIVITGYSQGAQTAVATLRLLETKYPEVAIKQCFAGSGPYDVARTYDVAMKKNNAGLSFTIPMLVMGTSWAYDLNLNAKLLLRKRAIERAEKYVFSKEHTTTEVVLMNRIGVSKKVSRYMTPEGMDKTQPETRRLYEGLVRSSIIHVDETDTILGDWTPKTPIFLLHSTQDRCVPFENALSLRLMLETKGVENVEYDFGKYGDHVAAMVRYLDILAKRL